MLLHVADHDPLPEVERLLQGYAASGAGVLVLSAVTGAEGYDSRPALDDDGWMVLLGNLDRLAELAASRDVRAVLHPHVGTMVETGEEVRQVLDGMELTGEPRGDGPVADVRASADYLRSVLRETR